MLDLKELLSRLIEIPSYGEYTPDRERLIVNYLKDLVTKEFPSMEVIEVTVSDYVNLLCLGSRNPKILLACHVDTVPPSKHDHTKAFFQGDKAYGLGAKDMKGGIVSSLLSLSMIEDKASVGIVFYGDEEYKQKGIIGVSEVLPGYLKNSPQIIISPESRFNIGYGARGIIVLDISVKGQKSHSARPHLGKDAILGFFDCVNELKVSLNRSTDLGDTTTVVTRVEGGLLTEAGSITSHAGSIPDFIRAQISIRNSQVDLAADSVLEMFSRLLAARGLLILEQSVVADHPARSVPYALVSKYIDCAKSVGGFDIELGDPKIAGYNDADILGRALGSSVINFGPYGDKNHTADEWVSLASIEKVAKIFALWANNIQKIT